MAMLIELPPRVPEWEGTTAAANDITLLLTVSHVDGYQRGLLYQVCDVSQLIDLHTDPQGVSDFILNCGLRMIAECYAEILMHEPEWPPSEMVWEFSITRTAPGAQGFGEHIE